MKISRQRKKVLLTPAEKTELASRAALGVLRGDWDEATAGRMLRAATGTQWGMLTALQYLSGQEAMAAANAWPESAPAGLTRAQVQHAILLANVFCSRRGPRGGAQSAGRLVQPLGALFDEFRHSKDGERHG